MTVSILQIHTRYTQAGGEDRVVAEEHALLRRRGHAVRSCTFDNRELEPLPPLRQVARALWNRRAAEAVRRAIEECRPDVVHIHNTFLAASPAAVHAAARRRPVVVTLHNYRLACANGLFWRQGKTCEACCGRLPWRAALYGCWQDSRPRSAAAAAVLALQQALGTWRQVDAFIALTPFVRDKAVAMGLPEDRIHIKPNVLVTDPGPGEGRGGFALFVGRLSPEKGLGILFAAWQRLGRRLPLVVVGDGPLAEQAAQAAERVPGVEWRGPRPADEVLRLMQQAAFLVFPSLWYEAFPRVILEAFACGLPVLCSRLGSPASLVAHGRTGLHFQPGDAADLVRQVEELLASPPRLAAMRHAARREFEEKYTVEKNYAMLMAIYEQAVRRARERLGARPGTGTS